MVDTAVRCYLGQPGTTETTLYTVAASTTIIVRQIQITNTTSTAATFKMSIGADAAGTRLFSDFSVAANDVLEWTGFLVLAAGETLRAQQGTSGALTFVISAVTVT